LNIPADATREASKLLDQVWASPFGVDIPVDPIHIAQTLGVEVYTADLDSAVAGLLVKRQGRDAEIYLNSEDSKNRQRFTAAHELGHYVRRSTGSDDAWDYVDRRDALSSLGTDPEERQNMKSEARQSE
jgi:Zn-dependent peptidase ImmA (M78 family)